MMISTNSENIYLDELEALIIENEQINPAEVFEEEDHHLYAGIYMDTPEYETLEFI